MYTEEELYDMNHGAAIDERVEQEVLEMRRRGESVVRVEWMWVLEEGC